MANIEQISNEERILNCIPSQKTEQDFRFEHALEAGISEAEASIPDKKDLREDWWKINNQERTGACVGWATADSVLRWHFVKENRLSNDKLLSPRYVWMAAKETDEFTTHPTTFIESVGTSPKAALEIVRKYGIVTIDELSFTIGDPRSDQIKLFDGSEAAFYTIATKMRISNYFNLGRNLSDWRKWIAEHGPIITRLDVDQTWDNASSTNGNLDTYKPETKRGGHAVALVGYDKDRFIVRNSWGTGWGDKGFGYASNDYAANAFTEAYGVAL
jgi:hypothetical protein